MYRAFRTEGYEQKLRKLSPVEQKRVENFEKQLKLQPYSSKPLGYPFLREKKFNGKRMLFLIYEQHKVLFLITITNKKAQQADINFIRLHLEVYKEELLARIQTL